MIVVVSGSRTITDYDTVAMCLERCLFDITELWHGAQAGKYVKGADGVTRWLPTVDLLAALWANKHHIPVRKFPADWDKHGKAAGPIRNGEMATEARRVDGGLVTVWDGKSRGTDDCARQFSKLSLPHFEYNQATDVYNFYTAGKYK